MPTINGFTLDQLHAMLKTLGIAAANLWSKSNKFGPQSAVGAAADEELLQTLKSISDIATMIVASMEVQQP